MRVRDLPLAEHHVAHFEAAGIEELYPPQAAAVEAGVCDGENVVTAIPTAAGKTFIAQLAMLTAEGPGLYIVPLRALAREKYETFAELPDVDVGVSTGDYDAADGELAAHDVVVATSEKVDSAIRNGAEWVEDLGCVVADEVHLLGAERRGPTLEVTLANLRRRVSAVQVVGLSATVANPEEVANWLDATLVESRWRPVALRTGVYADGAVIFDDDTTLDVDAPAAADETAATVELVRGALDDGGQALAFVRSRAEAERLAERLADRGVAAPAPPELAEELQAVGAASQGRKLADCAREGVAFHHAGLASAQRAAVEAGFRDRDLGVIAATPTLAAGVNVPARRVVVRDTERYTGSGMEPLPVLEVHQMCGRAGRPHLDPHGEAVLVAEDADDATRLRERYVGVEPEAIESKLADRAALRTHVLSIVATGFAESRAGVRDVLAGTFHVHQRPEADLGGLVNAVLAELVEMGMLVDDGTLAATALGGVVSRQYVRPETGARIVAGLRTAVELADRSELTVLEIVCDTPDMVDTYLGNRERAEMYEFARERSAELTTGMGETEDFEGWLESVKTARILLEWCHGADVDELVERYRLGPGDLESRLERAEWLLGAADAIADLEELSVPEIEALRERL